LLGFILWPVQADWKVLTWCATLIIIGLTRLLIHAVYRRGSATLRNIQVYARAYLTVSILYFIGWGLGGVWVMPTTSPVHEVIVFFFLMGLAGSAMAVFSINRNMHFIVIVILLFPATIKFLLSGSIAFQGMSIATVMFFLSALRSSSILRQTMHQNILLKHELAVANLNELTQFVDTANAPIFGIDAQGNVNEWNQQAEQITGFTKQEVMGRDLVDNFITDDYKLSVGKVLAKALQGDETANYEFPLFTQSGDRVDVLLNSTTRRDASGQIVGVVGVGQDITELNKVRIEQENERKEASKQLIQSSKLATLGEMATSVAHELNQPLNVIRMAAGNMRRRLSKGIIDPQYLNDKLLRIEEQTVRSAAIIDHMRMFGREATELPESIDPRAVVVNALDLVSEQLRLAGIEVMTVLAEDCGYVMGHAIQIEQVILNLLTNARDAIDDGEGMAEITLRVFEGDKVVHISVQDTGGGIASDILDRIFEPFYTTKEMGKGTGLGLSVSYGIVRDMEGTIIAENVDDGARFTITLPIFS
jgi:PAS domain S-box-containing protein